jgi:hypothetical protein
MRGCGHIFVRLGFVLTSLGMVPGVSQAAPVRCDLPVTVTPPNLPAGARTARIHIPGGLADAQIRASSGTAGSPVSFGAGTVEAEFQASADSPPIVIVAAVGANACGYSVIRVAAPRETTSSPSPVTLTLVEPGTANADQDADVLVYVFATDERGNPRRGSAPTIQPSVGSVARVESLGHGAWRARWRVPAGDATASAVTAAFGLEPSVATSLARKPGTPQTIEITQDAGAVGAAGSRTSVVVRIRDSAGNLTDEALVLESDVAQFDAPVRLERGVYQVPVVIPPGTRDTAILITARADRAVSTASLAVAPSAAAQVRVSPHEPIVADGSSQGRFEVLEVEVVDAFGKPVDDVPAGSGGRGEFRPALPISPGHWALPYRPPRVSEDTTEQVVITAGPATTKVGLVLRARRLSVSLGLKGGVGFAGGGVGPAAGVEAGLWKFFGRTQLGLVLDVDWWMISRTSTATVGGVESTFDATQSYLPFLLSVGWRTPFADRWMVWATVGGGGALVSNRSQLSGQPSVSESGFAPAASGSLSLGPRLGPGWLFLEARATWIGDPKLSTLSGSTFTFLGLLGYRFDVG